MDEFQRRIAEQEQVLTVIKPPRHFVRVGRLMLCGDTMPRSHDAALEPGECGFDSVRVNFAAHVFFFAVGDGLVPVSELCHRGSDRRRAHRS